MTKNGTGPAGHGLEFDNVLDMFAATVARDPDRDLIRYGEARLTARRVDELSDAFAVGLAGLGLRPGDRAVLYMQNVPQFVIAQLGIWKAGAIAVSANPMYKDRELAEILRDSGATVLIALESLYVRWPPRWCRKPMCARRYWCPSSTSAHPTTAMGPPGRPERPRCGWESCCAPTTDAAQARMPPDRTTSRCSPTPRVPPGRPRGL